MSKLIEALNRLQSLKEEPLVKTSEPLRVFTPSSPNPPTSPQGEWKKTSLKNPVKDEGAPFNMALETWVGMLQQEYLRNFVRAGGGAIKMAVFPDEESLQDCQPGLDGLAK